MNRSRSTAKTPNGSSAQRDRRVAWSSLGVVYALVAVVAVALAVYPSFATLRNIENIFNQSAPLMAVGMAVTVVLIGGNFDLSVGATFGVSGLVFAKIVGSSDFWVAVVSALVVGMAFGLVNAVLVAYLELSSFMATFATGLTFLGVGFIYETGRVPVAADAARVLGDSDIAGFPSQVLVVAALAVALTLVLSRTSWGRAVYASGGNFEAARLAGLRARRTVGSTFVLSGLLCAVAGVLAASRMATGSADVGSSIPLSALAVAVIGGTSIWGGRGAVWRTLVGVLVIAVLGNVFNGLSAPSSTEELVSGLAILAAIAIQKRPAGRI